MRVLDQKALLLEATPQILILTAPLEHRAPISVFRALFGGNFILIVTQWGETAMITGPLPSKDI